MSDIDQTYIHSHMAIPAVVKTLYGEVWSSNNYDRKLREAVQAVLDEIGAVGVLVSYRHNTISVFCPAMSTPPNWGIDFQKMEQECRAAVDYYSAEWGARSNTNANIEFLELNKDFSAIVCSTFIDSNERIGKFEKLIGVLVYSQTMAKHRLLPAEKKSNQHDRDQILGDIYRKEIGLNTAYMLLDTFRNRQFRFAAFPPELSERYWIDSLNSTSNPKLRPPWDRSGCKNSVETATLSLDLRKSTYCMEYARSNSEFGNWLSLLTEKMLAVTHLHGGVFDKFTGDGALIHFLEKESQIVYSSRCVDMALECAVDLQRTIEDHMLKLRSLLQHDSPLFGAGIAVDVGDAYWSCDHRNNPIVVGRAVVGACRAGDGAKRKMVRLTNIAYHSLSGRVRNLLSDTISKTSLQTKENTSILPLECWEFEARSDLHLGKGVSAISEICIAIDNF